MFSLKFDQFDPNDSESLSKVRYSNWKKPQKILVKKIKQSEPSGGSALANWQRKVRNISPALLLLLLPRRQIPSLFPLINNDKLAGKSNVSPKTRGKAPAS